VIVNPKISRAAWKRCAIGGNAMAEIRGAVAEMFQHNDAEISAETTPVAQTKLLNLSLQPGGTIFRFMLMKLFLDEIVDKKRMFRRNICPGHNK
jgi:hypothetical protein